MRNSTAPSRPVFQSFIRIFLPAFVLLSAMSIIWALASPIFSSPDENAHATKAIAQVHGEVVGKQVKGAHGIRVDLPDSYRYMPQLVCFAYHPDVPADCGVELGDPRGTTFFDTWVGAYNPVYYYIVGWPSLVFGGSTGLIAMRIMSALLSSAFLALAFQIAFAARRTRWAAVSVAFLASPVILYMAGSVNPQGLEISAAAALWIALPRLLQKYRNDDPFALSKAYLWSVVVASAALLAMARAVGPLWVMIIVVSCFVIIGWPAIKRLLASRASYIPIAIIAGAGLFSLVWTLGAGSLSGQAAKGDAPLVGGSFLAGVAVMLRDTPSFIAQAVGIFGWLDTTPPAIVFMPYFIAFAILAALAITASGRRGLAIVTGLIALSIFVPVVVQAYSVHQTGIIWQGRYGIFLYVSIPLLSGFVLSSRRGARVAFLSTRITPIIAALLWIYSVAAFVFVLRRYVVGIDAPIRQMLSAPQWQPPLGWIALVALFIISSGLFFAWIVRLAILSSRREPVRELSNVSVE